MSSDQRRAGMACTIAMLCFSAPTLAQEHERNDQPPAPPRAFVPTSPAFRFSSTAASMVQVNVDKFGNNIVGDAANEPSIAIDPNAPNRMVIGWRQFDNVKSSFRQAGYGWSNDGGRTWHFDGVLEPGVFGSDPSLECNSEGRFYYMTLHDSFRTYLFCSEDGGEEWGCNTYATGGDKQWITVDRSGDVGDGNIYQIWSSSKFNRSIDDGQSFGPSKSVNIGWMGSASVGPDGELFLSGNSVICRSDNAKYSGLPEPNFACSTASLDGDLSGGGPNPAGYLGMAWVDVDRSEGPTRGHVYLLASVYRGGDDRLDVMFTRSTDGGLIWSPPVEITGESNGVNAYQWFGTMSVAPNGRIDAVWNDGSISNKINISELRYTCSVDGGQTWAPPKTLSPAWDSFIGWPNQDKIGDYYTMKSDLLGADLAWSATFTGGQDVYYMRIGDRDCNGNGVSDLDDIAAGTAKDCNANGIPDSCEIAAGAEADRNGNGVPDSCECYADFDGSGELDIDDFVVFQTAYGLVDLAADCDGSGELDVADFSCFSAAFGVGCP